MDKDVVSFNINAELYENDFGDLAIRFEGDKVYQGVGNTEGALFSNEASQVIRDGELPQGWQEISPREILYGHGWHLISSLGFIDGNMDKPAVELEVLPDQLGATARKYLENIL